MTTMTFAGPMNAVMARALRLAAASGEFTETDADWLRHWAEDLESFAP